MKSYTMAVVVCGVLAALLAYAAGDKGKEDAPEITLLKNKVEALEQRVAALEARLSGLQAPATIVVPQIWPQLKTVPQGWQQKEFNGLPYYLVPIRAEPGKGVLKTP